MRRIAIVFLAAVLLAGCTSSPPKLPAVFTPTATPATASARPGGSPSATVDTSAWITLAPKGEGFSVHMPCAATPASGSGTAVGGSPYTYTDWTCTEASGRAFLVSQTKLAPGTLAGPAKPFLDYSENSYLKGFTGAQVVSQSDITLDGHAGRTAVFANSTTVVHGEMVIVGDTQYVVGASYPVGLADDGTVDAFMASFTLTA
jgi:hypothetical protein